MSQYSRSIDVGQNLVFFDAENPEVSINIDCSQFAQEQIKFVCEEDGVMWIEQNPFSGRIYEYNWELVEQVFEQAKQKWIEKNDYEMSLIDVTPLVYPYDALLNLNDMGFSEQYDQWTSAANRSFVERAFFAHSLIWRRDDQPLIDMLTSFGMSSEQIDDFFEACNTK